MRVLGAGNLTRACLWVGLTSQSDRIKRVRALAAKLAGKEFGEVRLPWYIMTSPMTHEATQTYFEENKCVPSHRHHHHHRCNHRARNYRVRVIIARMV